MMINLIRGRWLSHRKKIIFNDDIRDIESIRVVTRGMEKASIDIIKKMPNC